MSTNCTHIEAPPADVFAVLADANTYEHWVVGCDDIRAVEGEWPAVGSKFFHTVGAGPVKVKDNTKVIEVEKDKLLVLEARARPAGVAKVIFRLTPIDGGTDVEIEEFPIRGLAKLIDNPVQNALMKARNVETLRRLTKQVDDRRSAPTT